MSSLKDRIAALQANSAPQTPSKDRIPLSPTSSPTAGTGGTIADNNLKGVRLKDKIARFDRIGGTPVPLPGASFGLGVPPQRSGTLATTSRELYGNRPGLERPPTSRSASLRTPRSAWDPEGIPAEDLAALPSSHPRSRSVSDQVPAPLDTSPRRPSKLSPHYTGEGSYIGSPQSLRSESPISGRAEKRRSVSDIRKSLTQAAVSNLPISPSLRPTSDLSSVATDVDAQSERSNLTATRSSRFGSTAPSIVSSMTSEGPGGPMDDKKVIDRAQTITPEEQEQSEIHHSPKQSLMKEQDSSDGSARSASALSQGRPTTPSYYAQLNEGSWDANSSQPRPSTPSYMSQAASMFPPSRRQSIHITSTNLPNIPAPIPDSPTGAMPREWQDKFSPTHTRGPSSIARWERSPPRPSMETAYYSAADASSRSQSEASHGSPPRFQSLTSLSNSAGVTPANALPEAPGTPGTPKDMLSAFPSPPSSAVASPTSVQQKKGASRGPPTATAVETSPVSTKSSTTSPSGAKRLKKPKLIPGKWITSDDERSTDDEGEEGSGKGWARIIMPSQVR